jgi:16S rRNA (guanine966-N2)-methyltransferase
VERVLARGPAPAGGQGSAAGQDSPAPAAGQDSLAPASGQDSPAPAGGQDSPAPAGGQDSSAQDRYNVVFADPPYAMPAAEVAQMLNALAERGWLAPGALVVVERATRSGPLNWPNGFLPDRARRYGEATFWYGHVPEHPPKNRRDDTACNA